ncbi:hypothetical protein Tco_0281085 [Tanacetum coccineum]
MEKLLWMEFKLVLVKNLEGGVKFLMYPRFVQVFVNQQLGDMSHHKKIFVTPSHTKKVFGNMKREGKGFSGRVTPLFQTMMVQAQEEVGEGSEIPTDPQHTSIITQPSTSQPHKKQPRRTQRKDTEVPQPSGSTEPIADEGPNEENVPTHSNDSLLSSEDSIKLNELMELCTKLQQRVLDLEHTKTTHVTIRKNSVATKSGQVSVNAAKQSSPRAAVSISTARLVNTAAPKSKVNDSQVWNKRFYLDMVHIGAVPKPPSNEEDTERPRKKSKKSSSDGTEGPSDPRYLRNKYATSMAEFMANMNRGAGGDEAGGGGVGVEEAVFAGASVGSRGCLGSRWHRRCRGNHVSVKKKLDICVFESVIAKKGTRKNLATATLQGGNNREAVYKLGAVDAQQDPKVVTELGSFDIIIGMDWLSRYDAAILCGEKKVRIPLEGKTLVIEGDRNNSRLKIVSCIKAQKYIEKGCELFLAQVTEQESKEKRLEDVPVIRDFPEVFPDELPGLPPPRQVEFRIDLIPGAAPVARAPYRLAPSEMKELSKQLQELSEKGFIRPSSSPWGAPVLFVKKKDDSLNVNILQRTDDLFDQLKGKANVVADALSKKDKEPIRVRALVVTVHNNLPEQIRNAQVEACKEENIGAEGFRGEGEPFEVRSDGTKYLKGRGQALTLAEVSYNNSLSPSIKAAPFEALSTPKDPSAEIYENWGVTTQALEIDSLKRRVKKLENKKRSRTHGLKRLYKVGLSAKVISSDDEGELDWMRVVETESNVVNAATTTSTTVSAATITEVDITLAQALAELKSTKPKAVTTAATTTTTAITRPKAKGLFIQEQDQASTPTPIVSFSQSSHAKDNAEFDEEARIAREKEEANVSLIEEWNDIQAKNEKRRKFFAAKKVKEKRNRPSTKDQQRSIMCTYLKNMAGWKAKDLKNKSFANVQELFDKALKRVNTFVDFRTESVEESSKKADVIEESTMQAKADTTQEGSSKKAREELVQESSKKQKVDENNESEELKKNLEIVPNDGDDVTIEATPFSVKILIMYLTFTKMLKNFNREDMEVLWKIGKARFKKTKPVNYMDEFLLLNLKTMFKHHVEDSVWKEQQGLVKVLS